MPYDIHRRGNRWIVRNSETGEVKSTHATREKALNHMRLLYHVEAGGKVTRAE